MTTGFSPGTFDVAIIGAGPAGCAAAIAAARAGASVHLLERGPYPRHKVCGEFVSPEALALLRELLAQGPGASAQAALAAAPRIARAHVFLGSAHFTARIEPAALSVARFD